MQIHDSGLDYVTLTMKRENPVFDKAMRFCEKMLSELHNARFETKRHTWNSYEGYKIGKVFSGERDDGLIIKVSGSDSKYVETKVRQSAIEFNCTRCDLQATAKLGTAQADYPRRMCEKVANASGELERKKATVIALYQVAGNPTGCTLGSRSSYRYSRFYDKTAEQRNRVESGLWRFETEFKGSKAKYIWRMTMAAAASRWLALSVVRGEFERQGFDMRWMTGTKPQELPSSYEPSTPERQINWLKSHVSGTVQRLIEQGYEEAVYEALGLTIPTPTD